ncbi:MAG: phospholipase D-like domain-containing protein [Elusimicrobiota bacterium]
MPESGGRSARTAGSVAGPESVLVSRAASPRIADPDASSHAGLRTAARALSQEGGAGRRMPALARLGARLQAPGGGSGLASLRAAAERFFNRKAGLQDAGSYDEASAVTGALSDDASKTDAGESRDASGRKQGPKYSARKIEFNGRAYPSVAFRPDRPIEPLIVSAIDAAEKSIEIALYEFKNQEILKALRRAQDRGVKVRVIIDYYNAYPRRRPGADYWPHRSLELQSLVDGGFDVTVVRGAQRYGIMHNKFAVFDGKMGLFGSYNWSYTSERNHYENVNFTADEARVRALAAYWKHLRSLGVAFDKAKDHKWPREARPPPADEVAGVVFNGVRFPAWLFTPDGAGEDLVVKAIGAADKSVDLSMFTLSSPRIARALLDAKKRKVKVRVLLDETQAGQDFMRPYAEWLAYHKIPVKTLAGPNPDGPEWAEKNHNKLMILDGKLVVTGSLNYTKSGFLTNFENAFLLDHKTDAGAYEAYFEDMYGTRRAKRVVPPAAEPKLPTDEELTEGLQGEPEPPPPAPVWSEMPASREIAFNGENFPSNAVRPQHPVEDLLVKAVDASAKTIELALYEFNLEKVLEAFRRAKKRGVKVRFIIDFLHVFPRGTNHSGQERERTAQIQALIDEGFDVRVLRGVTASGIMHHKFAVFDGKMVEFGSYNYTRASEEHHFESVKFEADAQRVAFYGKVWEWMRGYAVTVAEAEDHEWAKERPESAPVDKDHAIELNGERFPRQAFSPSGLVEDTLIRAVRAAKTTIEIAMFSFYSVRIAEELLQAKQRGVHVAVVLDRMQSKLMKLDDWFAYHDFDVKIVAGPNPDGDVFFEKNHNKFMVVDGKLLETGSFNYTGNAEKNSYENANFFDDPTDVAFYRAYFKMLHDTGWRPLKPKRPPEDLSQPSEFFARPPSEDRAKLASRLSDD